MISEYTHQLPLSLDWVTGQRLADFLNRQNSANLPESEYIRWVNAGSKGQCPDIARQLFSRQFVGHVSRVGTGLEVMGLGHRDSAVWCLIALTRSGSLDRMRDCPHCGRWFFAENRKSKFCLPAHRSAYFAAHAGRERAALINRQWRIENVHLPTVNERIAKLETIKRQHTKGENIRLENARHRRESLRQELRQIKTKL